MSFSSPFLLATALMLPVLARLLPATPAGEPRRASLIEADVRQTLLSYHHARQVGDSAAAIAAFTPSARIVDQTERPVHSRYVYLTGCRGWCRPAPPLQNYQVSILPDSARALAVETYCLSEPVSRAARRRQRRCYTAISVLLCQRGQWLISSRTLSWQAPH